MAEPHDPWAAFRVQDDVASVDPGPDPWAAFRMPQQQPQPLDASGPITAADTAFDVADQGLRGLYRGADWMLSLPGEAVAAAVNTVAPGEGDRFRWPGYLQPPSEQIWGERVEPRTTAGRYAHAAAESVGVSAIPMLGMAGKALQAAGPAARTTLGRVGQDALQAFRAAPVTTAATDTASAATSAIGVEAAKDAGAPAWVQAMAGLGAGIIPALGMSLLRPQPQPIGTQTGRTIARQRADAAVADDVAFREQEVRPFGPAYNQGPIAAVGKQLTETPVVGAPLRNNLDETMHDAAAAVGRLADDISPAATHETAGVAVQGGLDRFRDRSFTELAPGTVRQLGINPNSPVQRQQGGGAEQMRRIAAGQPVLNQVTGGRVSTSRGRGVGLPRTQLQRMTSRTTLEDLSDAELDRVIRTSAEDTSFSTRLDALYEKAFRGMPPLLRQDGSVDPMLLPTANSGAVVRGIIGDEARTGVRAGLQGRYGDMFATLANPQANVPLATLRAMRTAIGRDLSNFGLYETSLDRTQLNSLYRALSSDIEVGMQDIAVRAAQATLLTDNRQITVPVARRAAQALRDLQVANRYARAGFERMDRFLAVVKQPNPQAAAKSLVRAATEGGTGNMRMFRGAMSVLQPEERSAFAALIVRSMGEPTDGAQGIIQEAGFSPTRFATAYRKMAPEARNLIFSQEHQRRLAQLFQVADRLAGVEALANTSRSATNAMNLSALGGAGATLAAGDVATPLAIGGSMLGASVLMSRPAYTQWLIGYMQLRAAVREGTSARAGALLRHLAGLERMSMHNPALWPVYAHVMLDLEEAQPSSASSEARR